MDSSTATPLPQTTVRRNPPRRARPTLTPLATAAAVSFSLPDDPKPKPLSDLLEEASHSPPPPPPAATTTSSSSSAEEHLKVFLRIRPLPEPRPRAAARCKGRRRGGISPKAKEAMKNKMNRGGSGDGGGVCLVSTSASSVTLSVPQSKLLDPKRSRTEVYDGFSSVFPPDSSQHEIFTQVMNPLVIDFLEGKSGLLVAMGPTGSGKTHTVFGSPRNPGIVPLTLRQIFCTNNASKDCNPLRSFYLSMFEILSERGKGERILDLLSDAADLSLQQSTVKGLQEVVISNLVDAENLVSCGMLKRSSAATNANSQSSRSQCIITIRVVHKSIDDENDFSLSSAVLTIADLAGAEREKRTGNRGSRLLESNFINNTSMVFGLCLRSLLEHQKNPKKPLEKHFKNSTILNVKPGEDDYLDTSFLLRQASPYMKIKYASLEDPSGLASQKRSNISLICKDNYKRRKFDNPEALLGAGKNNAGTNGNCKVSEKDEGIYKVLNAELLRVTRSEEIMKKFARAFWSVLKQYKQKLLESENAAESLREALTEKNIQIMKLEKKLKDLNSYCSCQKVPIVDDSSFEQKDALSASQATQRLVSLSNQTDLGCTYAVHDNFHFGEAEVSEEFTGHGPKSSADGNMRGTTEDSDVFLRSLIEKQELSFENLKTAVQVDDQELDKSESCSKLKKEDDGGAVCASDQSVYPCNQSFTGQRRFPYLKSEWNSAHHYFVSKSQSPQSTGHSKRALIDHCREEIEELNKLPVVDIQCSFDIREGKHHDFLVTTEQGEVDAKDGNTSQSLLDSQEMLWNEKIALQLNAQVLDFKSESCNESKLKDSGVKILESDKSKPSCNGSFAGHCEYPNPKNDNKGILPSPRKERPSPVEATMVAHPTDKYQAEEIKDKYKDGSASRPCNTKKTRRRLLPAAAMLLKEFTGPDMDADIKRDGRVKASSEGVGRSDALMRLLKISTT